MHSRFLAGVGVAVGLMTAAPCLAASDLDPDGIYEHVLGRRPGGGGGIGGSGFGFSASPASRTVVAYAAGHRPGTIFISTRERRLYYVLGNGQAIQYGIGVGRVGFTWSGVKTVSAKREWPAWTPPAQMLRRRPDLPRFMRGGEDNPLGARAIYLGSSLYRIHGSNEPETIGQAVSSGCFRLTNEDVIDLYNRVRVGATVIVQH
jgi:lipoprotein-anchoring transpeptidase ErfK/SrfK